MYFHCPLTMSGSLGFKGEAEDEAVGRLLVEVLEPVAPVEVVPEPVPVDVPVVLTLPLDVEDLLVLVLDIDVVLLVRALRDA